MNKNQNTAFEFDGGYVRLTDLGGALVATAQMLGSLLVAASVAGFSALMVITLALYFAGFHPLGL